MNVRLGRDFFVMQSLKKFLASSILNNYKAMYGKEGWMLALCPNEKKIVEAQLFETLRQITKSKLQK
jgi:hypothetical protein